MANYGYWVRVNLAVEICVKEAAIDVAHNKGNHATYIGLPANPQLLYQRLSACRQNQQHGLNRVLRPNQWLMLCPPNGQTVLKDCDLTVILAVVRSENVVAPQGGWNIRTLAPNDKSWCIYVFNQRT